MELSLIGLQNAGKTSLVNVIAVSKSYFESCHLVYVTLPLILMLMAEFSFMAVVSRPVDIVKTWSQRCVILKELLFHKKKNHSWEFVLIFYPLLESLSFVFITGLILQSWVLRNLFYLQVGFNMRKVTKGNVTIKLWDLGGQPRFRSMWERYCRAVSAIVYVWHF